MLSDDLRVLVESVDPALVVVTTVAGSERSGCLVGFHSQCSLGPPGYAVWISRVNHTAGVAVEADWFVVHLLDAGQQALAAHFGEETGDAVDKLASVRWTPGPGGAPLLEDCERRLVLRRRSLIDDEAADHLCVLGTVEEVHGATAFEPYRLRAGESLDPGHDA